MTLERLKQAEAEAQKAYADLASSIERLRVARYAVVDAELTHEYDASKQALRTKLNESSKAVRTEQDRCFFGAMLDSQFFGQEAHCFSDGRNARLFPVLIGHICYYRSVEADCQSKAENDL